MNSGNTFVQYRNSLSCRELETCSRIFFNTPMFRIFSARNFLIFRKLNNISCPRHHFILIRLENRGNLWCNTVFPLKDVQISRDNFTNAPLRVTTFAMISREERKNAQVTTTGFFRKSDCKSEETLQWANERSFSTVLNIDKEIKHCSHNIHISRRLLCSLR